MPCNNQIRNLLDPLMPRHPDRVYLAVFAGLEQYGSFSSFRGLADQLLLALDGTQYFASNTIQCPNCLRRHPAKGPPSTICYYPGDRVPGPLRGDGLAA
jgi:hypothetical protein